MKKVGPLSAFCIRMPVLGKVFQSLAGSTCYHGCPGWMRTHFTALLLCFRNLVGLARRVYQNNYMIRSMVARDLRVRYIGSYLGFFWTIVHPLTQIAIYYFIFSIVLKVRLGPGHGGADFAVWLIAGILPWFLVAEVVNRAPMAVLEQSTIIAKTVFPSELLPLAQLISALVTHLIALLIFMGFLAVSGSGPSPRVLMVFPAMLVLSLFVLGMSWLLAALNVFLRDIGQFVTVLVNIWFYLNPIIYPVQKIPESVQRIYCLNPMVHIIEAYRLALLGESGLSVAGIMYVTTFALAVFTLGGFVFKKLKPSFAVAL